MKLNRNSPNEKIYYSVSNLRKTDLKSIDTIDLQTSFTETLEIIEQIIEPKYLNKIQILILEYTWQGLSYLEISTLMNYNAGYVKDTGSKIWKMLSEILEVKVTKYNVQIILKQYMRKIRKSTSVDWQSSYIF